MMLYISIIISVVLASVLVYVVYQNINLKVQSRFLENSVTSSQSELEILENSKIEYIQKIEQLSGQLKYQEQFISEFEKLRDESKQSTKAALFDLGNELSKQLIDIHKKENKESREVSEKNIQETSTKFNSEFERIVNMVGALSKEVSQSKDIVDVIKNSLLSPSGAGNLAEITLENILKSSGLRNNLDFIMQYSLATEDKAVLRPDSVVFLPGDKLMVIDAKASKFLVDDQDDLKNLARTMNIHLRSLSGKNYAEMVKKSLSNKEVNVGNILTLMFVPSEHAIEKIIEADSDFMNKAWMANIFPVGPAGLMNMLSFAKFQISEQLMMYNHQQIIEEVKKLIASVGNITEHSVRLGSSLSSTMNHYDKFAASFNRNFLSKARNISKMGIEGTNAKKTQEPLQRFQVIALKSELIDIEPQGEVSEIKNLENS
jgi:DNA recombination protein RmuC